MAEISKVDLGKIRNDASIPVADVMANFDRIGVDLHYGEIMLRVEQSALDGAIKWVRSKPPADLRHIRLSVDRALRRSLPKMLNGRFSKKVADDFCADMLLWEALKRAGN